MARVGRSRFSSLAPIADALALLGSLRAPRPLMFHFAQESMGRDTPKGRDFADLWQYAGFRHGFRA